jgi:hypothetical protein
MEYLTLELKERLEAKLAEYEKEVTANGIFVDPVASGKVQAIKEALEIFNEVVDYHEELEEEEF